MKLYSIIISLPFW